MAKRELDMSAPGEQRIGRRLFVGLLAAGGVVVAGGAQLFSSIGQLPVLKTLIPKDGFYFYTVSSVEPRFDGQNWDLRIEGLVKNPLTLSFKQLIALKQSDQTHDYMCVTGWKVQQVRWQGPLVSTLIDLAGALPEATAISFDSADGVYTDSLLLEEARRPEVLLAHSLNGAPLEADRGAALRLVIPFMFGYKGTKWVSRIRLTAQQEIGYWEQRGYDVNAYLK
ncbi:MAG TPA: molybdopterin-dependent oxidoreductase [Candidatus Dormibacteraeota bacterium]|jgi:DMSO/TMAO reductase YedYZ molybdopterin-dependent catalytic subunit|nr:molybdopterin-dependent oxidoreductase [Candidatus Dormibacteraeota bacterium]